MKKFFKTFCHHYDLAIGSGGFIFLKDFFNIMNLVRKDTNKTKVTI